MVLADSDRIARVPSYLGTPLGLSSVFAYATITLFGAPFQALPLTVQGPTADPQPRCHLRDIGLGCSRFARHYYGNHSLFSFPQGTEMFHFPWFAPPTLCIQAGVTRLFAALGFPIRTSPDQRLVGNSPELFAATHVLHRLLAPRHPPHALSSLLTSISRLTPASRRDLSKLETKVQAPALRGGPGRITCLTQRSPAAASRRLLRSDSRLLSAEIEFYPSYAVFKERFAS